MLAAVHVAEIQLAVHGPGDLPVRLERDDLNDRYDPRDIRPPQPQIQSHGPADVTNRDTEQ